MQELGYLGDGYPGGRVYVPKSSSGDHCGGQYASYWNAVLQETLSMSHRTDPRISSSVCVRAVMACELKHSRDFTDHSYMFPYQFISGHATLTEKITCSMLTCQQ